MVLVADMPQSTFYKSRQATSEKKTSRTFFESQVYRLRVQGHTF